MRLWTTRQGVPCASRLTSRCFFAPAGISRRLRGQHRFQVRLARLEMPPLPLYLLTSRHANPTFTFTGQHRFQPHAGALAVSVVAPAHVGRSGGAVQAEQRRSSHPRQVRVGPFICLDNASPPRPPSLIHTPHAYTHPCPHIFTLTPIPLTHTPHPTHTPHTLPHTLPHTTPPAPRRPPPLPAPAIWWSG